MTHPTLPFPDLTGLRSTANDRHAKHKDVCVEQDGLLSLSELQRAAAHLGNDVDADNLLMVAWTIVLVHLLSPEDECQVNLSVQRGRQQSAICFESDRGTRKSILLRPLIDSLRDGTRATHAASETALGNVMILETGSAPQTASARPDATDDAAVSLIIRYSPPQDRVTASLRSSTRLHSHGSAMLHLRQFMSCLQSLHSEATGLSPSLPAFSLSRYDHCLLASDNDKAREQQQDVQEGGLSRERFEYQFERVARRMPALVALDFRADLRAEGVDKRAGNIQLTYAEVDRISGLIADAILGSTNYEARTKEGHRVVALCLEKSHWTYLAIMGVLKAGAAWCPIDTDWPAARRKALLAKSGAQIVLFAGHDVTSSLQETSSKGMSVIRLDQLDLSREPRLCAERSRGESSDDLAYLIWTSGTTGMPKAVGIQHKAAVQALRSLQGIIPHDGSGIRYLQFSAYNFDLMILDMFYTWGLGGTLCSSTRTNLLTNLSDIANVLQVTHTLLTPAVMAMTPRELIPSLKVVINGGEKLSQIVADMWSAECCLMNLYGPAEATLIAMHRTVSQNDTVKAPNIGRALPTTSCHAIDADGNIVLKGTVGELVLGGFQCAIGYVGDPDKTADKFVNHPSIGRVYKTGDMVRQLWNADFEYLGRVDDQVKINGIRIELLEINATIRSAMDEVKDSETLVVPVKGGEPGSEVQIVNFSVVPSSGSVLSGTRFIRLDEQALQIARQLVEHARESLPTYMVPSLFLIASHFPKTSSAKIDREALKVDLHEIDILDWQNRIATAGRETAGFHESSPSDQEGTLRRHISSVCHIAAHQIGRHTPLSQLGLDSIRSITLSRRLNAEEGVVLSVVDVIKYNTLAQLAQRVGQSNVAGIERMERGEQILRQFDKSLRPALIAQFPEEVISKIMPATPLQEGMISETVQDPARYWLHRLYSLPEGTSTKQLRRTIERVLERVEILRTTFVARSLLAVPSLYPTGSFVQVVLERYKADIVECESVAGGDEDVTQRSRHMHTLDVSQPSPPVAFTIIEDPPRLVLHVHHSLYDQATLLHIGKEIEKSLAGHHEDKTIPFSAALPHILPLDKVEEEHRHAQWQRLLTDFPREASIEPLRLSIRTGGNPSSSVMTTYRLRTSIPYDSVTRFAQQMFSSVRPILQAALATLLARLCDTDQIMLGDSVSGRALAPSLLDVMGPVLATAAIPACVKRGVTARQLCKTLATAHNESLPHAHIPLSQIRGILELPRSSDLFHAVFVFEPPSQEEEGLYSQPHRLHILGDFGIAVEHKLAVEVSVVGDGSLEFAVSSPKGVEDQSTACMFLRQYEATIKQLMHCPDEDVTVVRISQQGDLEAVSRYSVPESVSAASRIPAFKAIVHQALSTPSKVAIELHHYDDDARKPATMSYEQLEKRSTVLALRLISTVPSKSVIAVTLDRSFDTYIALLGVLKSGCVYLPIDSSLPNDRKRLLLRDSGARCLISHRSTTWIKERATKAVILDEIELESGVDRDQDLPSVEPEDRAYILFTSGSTGTPKGCVLTHANLSSALASFYLEYERFAPSSLQADVRYLARSIESFDVALLEALLPLQSGGTVVTAPRHILLADLGKAMQSLKVTHAAVVPSLFYIDKRRVLPSDLPYLRALIVGGERLTRDIIQAWAGSRVPLLNAYGPTEACIGTSIACMQANDSTGNIGRPFGSTQYLVLRRSSSGQYRPAIRGEPGELCIGGLQVGWYHGQGQQEAFLEWNGKRIYRTGDEARMMNDDTVEYLGRMAGDTQVKVRGVRIELGEIDFALTQSGEDGLRTVTQLLSHEGLKSAQLVTFAATRISNSLDAGSIRMVEQKSGQSVIASLHGRAKRNLPSYMMPSFIIQLEALPIASISGKFDVKLLCSWFQGCSLTMLRSARLMDVAPKCRPLTAVEETIHNEIVRLFDAQDQITATTDLYVAGLDSLNIVALASALAKRGMRVDVGEMVANPTLEHIAANAQSTNGTSHEDINWPELTNAAQKALGEDAVDWAMPCLPLQASMIAQTLLESQEAQGKGSPAQLRYVNVARFSISSADISLKRLEFVIEQVLARHDIYRTVFLDTSNSIAQVVLKNVEIERRTFTPHDEDEWGLAAQRNIVECIGSIPPIRYRLSPAETVGVAFLDLAIHHALYDGVSLDALLEEISDFYHERPGQQTESKFASVIQAEASEPQDQKLDYWRAQLRDVTINPFPCLTGRSTQGDESSGEVRSLKKCLDRRLSDLQQHAKQLKVSLAMLMLANVASLYGAYVADDEVVVGVVLNGRPPELAKVHGPCVNTVPLRIRPTDDDALQQIKSTYAGALKNQHVNLSRLAQDMNAPDGFFNVLFSYVGQRRAQSGMFVESASKMVTEYPLAVEVETDVVEDRVHIQLVFNDHFLPEEQAQIFLKQIGSRLGAGHDDATSLYSMENANADDHPTPHFLTFFNEQAHRSPLTTAYYFTEDLAKVDEYTYADLDKASDIFAISLQSTPGDVIGVHLSQCAEIYPVLLAIWKAGKTYLPLDPKLPTERLEYMISIADPSLVITSKGGMDVARRLAIKATTVTGLNEVGRPSRVNVGVGNHSLDDTAYIMFTSGSSGKPKGVQVSHRALGAALISWKLILPHTPGRSRMLQLASPGFDVFLIEVCMPLALGFSFASAPKEVLLNDLEETFNRLQLTIADLPAALATTVHPDNLPRLEWLMSGGDQMDQRVINAWSDMGLVNAWGPTETTIGNTLGFVCKDSSRGWIGHAYPTSSLFVLQDDGKSVAMRGCIGELAVGGPQLADGYVKNKTLTEEKFVDILPPNAARPVRVYRTGDRGRMLSDGSVECLGRIEGDGQVKINSQRVELKEVEIALCQYARIAGVKDAAVLYIEHPQMASKRLVAFLILDRNSASVGNLALDDSPAAHEASSRCLALVTAHLPTYMIPQACLVLSTGSLPLSPNNKVDTRKLKDFYAGLDVHRLTGASQVTGPSDRSSWSPTERDLQKIIADFADVDPTSIERHTSLHRLGIDSISGFRLARRLREKGTKGVTARAILSSPTIASLAKSIKDPAAPTAHNDIHQAISLQDMESWHLDSTDRILAVMSCTPLQEGMLLESIASGGRLYVHHHVFNVDVDRIEHVMQSFQQLVERHEMLRTSFHFEEGMVLQAIHRSAMLHIEDIEADDMQDATSGCDRGREWYRNEEALSRPPVGMYVVRRRSHATIGIVLHHALYDGESLDMLFKQLDRLASGQTIEHTRVHFRTVLPYLLSSPASSNYWADALDGRRDTLISHSVNDATTCHVMERRMQIKTSQISSFAAKVGVTLHVVALFSYAKLLASLTGQRSVTFAQLFSLRDAVDGAENVVGPCLNTVLTPVDIATEETVYEALHRLQLSNDAGRKHRNASLAAVQRALVARYGRPARFDALFDLQRSNESEKTQMHVLRPLESQSEGAYRSTQYTLNVELLQLDEDLTLIATAHADTFSKARLASTLKRFEDVLALTLEKPDDLACMMPAGMTSLTMVPSAIDEAGQQQPFTPRKMDITQSAAGISLSALQETIVDVVAELTRMSVEHINRGTPLGHLGLDSIAAIHLASKLRKRGYGVGVADILQGKTIDGVADRVENRTSTQASVKPDQDAGPDDTLSAAKLLQVSPAQIEAVLDVLPGQLFELSASVQAHGPSGIFTFLYRLTNEVTFDMDRLQQAWMLLRKRHAVLRTSFVQLSAPEAKWVQVVWPEDSVQSDTVSASKLGMPFEKVLDGDEGLRWVEELLHVDDSLKSPPVTCHIIDAPEGSTLVLRLHHALYDAWSLRLLLDELSTLYRKVELPEAVPYVAYVKSVGRQRNELLNQAQDYWTGLFSDLQPSIVPSKRGALDPSAESFVFLRDSIRHVSQIERTLNEVPGGLPSLFLAAWATIISHICAPRSGDKVVFGSYQLGRSAPFDGIEDVVGNCMNVLPVVTLIETRQCIEHLSAWDLRCLAAQIKTQMDDRCHLETVSTLADIARWSGHTDAVPWNTYMNLLWPMRSGPGHQDRSAPKIFAPVNDVLTREVDQQRPSNGSGQRAHLDRKGSKSLDVRADVNIDVQLDTTSDSIHIGVRWRSQLWTQEEMRKVMHDLCQLVNVGCGTTVLDA